MNNLEEIFIPLIIFGAFGWMLKTYLDYRTRRLLIERDKVDENVKFLQQKLPQERWLSNLKWGLILAGIGVAAMLSWWFPRFISEEGTIGLMFLFAGIGFLITSAMSPRNGKNGQGPQGGGQTGM